MQITDIVLTISMCGKYSMLLILDVVVIVVCAFF